MFDILKLLSFICIVSFVSDGAIKSPASQKISTPQLTIS